MVHLVMTGVNRSVSKRLIRLRTALAAVLGDVGGHLPLSILVVIVLGVAAMLAFSGAKVWAEVPQLIPVGQFESEGALGVAVDNSTSESDASRGDVYVASYVTVQHNPATKGLELIPGRVNQFDISGNLLSPPSPFGVSPPSPFGEQLTGYSDVAVNPVNGQAYALDAFTSETPTGE